MVNWYRCCAAALLMLLGPGLSASAQVQSVAGVDMVARLTGPGSINNTPTVGIGGTDLGHMVVHQDKTYFLFGDTFSGETTTLGGNWRWNTMSFSSDRTPADGILFDGWITGTDGLAKQVFRSGYQNPITEIPTGAISIGNRIYTWFMSVNWWGTIGGEWTINYAGLAYTENLGQSFTIVSGFRLPSSTNFGMVAASTRPDAPDDPYVYVWGTPAGRFGGVKLARVLPASITNPSAYQYYAGLVSGQPTWSSSESGCPLIVPATVGEMSVMYNRAARCWTMMYFDNNRYAIRLIQAAVPWGPWGGANTVCTGSTYPGLYGSYMNPVYVENHGETVYFTMSLWDSYDVYLMRARLTVTHPPCPADFNVDSHVDQADMDVFASCRTRASVPFSNALACGECDLDHDEDIDQSDFAILQRCQSGPYALADPNCGK